jgi:hypothetical protein
LGYGLDMTKQTLSGGCHCGAVRFEIDVPAQVEVLDCNCSMCAKTGFLHLIVGQADFRLTTDPAALTDYRFNTGTARHLFCTTCGIKSFYVPRSHPDGYSVNLRALDDPKAIDATITPYDGRNWEAAREALVD